MTNYLVKPGSKVQLADYDPDDRSQFDGNKGESEDELIELVKQLDPLQERLYAEHRHALLFVLQGIDTGGKDGVIHHVFSGFNPEGCRVTNFKAPTSLELDHDYLWRAHAAMPRRGEIGIFNRSHYEDVLIVRVHNLAPREVWLRRYDQINAFEKMLSEEGTTICKFFLYISKDEQKTRLLARLQDETKQWKFNPEDVHERVFWDEYIEAYEAVLGKTSTEWAPWYVIPANRKWYRNLLVARIALETLQRLNPQYPPPRTDLSKVVIE